MNYRTIYRKHYGPIPLDEEGRTFDIHHLDGNHENNDPKNLVALSRKDHYELHLSQGDIGATLLLSKGMHITPKEKSELAKKASLDRVEKGTHHFLDSNWHRIYVSGRVENGTHHFLGGEIQRKNAYKKFDEGTHNFLHQKNPAKMTHTCPYCGRIGKGGSMFRWHFENCKKVTR